MEREPRAGEEISAAFVAGTCDVKTTATGKITQALDGYLLMLSSAYDGS